VGSIRVARLFPDSPYAKGHSTADEARQRLARSRRRPSAACWQARLSDCDCPTAESRDTVMTLAGSSACSCYCDTTPRFEQKGGSSP